MPASASASITILVLIAPGILRDSLLVFLRSLPQIGVLYLLLKPAQLLDTIHVRHPDTVILDADVGEEALLTLQRQLPAQFPELNSVVLVSSLRQQQSFLSAGARHVLLKGSLDDKLRLAVLPTANPGGM